MTATTNDNTVADESGQLKEKGNAAFKNGKFEDAIKFYTDGIRAAKQDVEKAVLYKNRAAAYLSLDKFKNVIDDCNKALTLTPHDLKALYRRSQARESLGFFEESYQDAIEIFKIDPENKQIKPVLERLHIIVKARADENAQAGTKVTKMSEIVFNIGGEIDKRRSAMNNLLVLSREGNGADLILKQGVVEKILKLLKTEKDDDIYKNAIRTIDEISNKSIERTKQTLNIVGIPWFLEILDSQNLERVQVAQHCLQTILNSFSGMENKNDSKPNQQLCDENIKEIDLLLTCLTYSITNSSITGLARDAVMELLTRNVHHSALNWAERLVDINGLHRLLEVCSELEEYKYESSMEITGSSRTIAAVCLARIYENMYHDALREKFLKQIDEYVNEKLLSPDFEAKVRVTVAITSLLLGTIDVGNSIISREGIMSMILAMATTDDILQQKVACECIVAATSKKDKAKAIINQGIDILKQLYRSKDDGVRVRALVGLCKLGSYGGLDASIRPFADGSTIKLAAACRQFLVKPGKDKDIRKWAVDGLSYLTLDAEVKEKLIDDRAALTALIQLAKTGEQNILYGAVTLFVNLCNAYDKQDVLPEMVELAKFAKQHIPEEHELDDPDFIHKRITVLTELGITSALVALSRTESHNSRELIARVLNSLCSLPELRGRVVADGGAKALLPLCFEGTEKGKRQAGQALSRIGITINPEVSFPGQRHLEVIRPLLNQLNVEYTALENFESLMALCNLAQMNETVRQRIIKEGGLQKAEIYLMEDHELLCRAAAQVICNMCVSDDVVAIHEKPNDRVKFLALLCMEEDEETAVAASGALAMLTSASKICCEKLFEPSQWLDVLHTLIANPSSKVQHRGTIILLNMINSGKMVAEKLIETDIMQLLMGLSQLPDPDRVKAREIALECLSAAEKYDLIIKTGEPDGSTLMPDPFLQAPQITEIE